MPGHKGKVPDVSYPSWLSDSFKYDITETAGADDLFAPSGIIRESEDNASDIFGVKTFYSTEGSSLSIKAMIFLALKHFEIKYGPLPADEKPYIITVGMCHKAFFHAVELLGIRVKRVEENAEFDSEVKKNVSKISELVEEKRKPIGVYITYPDYFGNIFDIKALKHSLDIMDIPLLIDGAHSAYFRFLDTSKYVQYVHPALFSDICSVSAHKTLPTLTGSAYLHINDSFKDVFPMAKHAMGLFGSSSPSYLIMASLDGFNSFAESYMKKTNAFVGKIDVLKDELKEMGFSVKKSDPLRIVVLSDEKYNGNHFASALREAGCEPECSDDKYVIMMLTPLNDEEDLRRIRNAFESLTKRTDINVSDSKDSYDCLKNFS